VCARVKINQRNACEKKQSRRHNRQVLVLSFKGTLRNPYNTNSHLNPRIYSSQTPPGFKSSKQMVRASSSTGNICLNEPYFFSKGNGWNELSLCRKNIFFPLGCSAKLFHVTPSRIWILAPHAPAPIPGSKLSKLKGVCACVSLYSNETPLTKNDYKNIPDKCLFQALQDLGTIRTLLIHIWILASIALNSPWIQIIKKNEINAHSSQK
jgi:hypothetical protein